MRWCIARENVARFQKLLDAERDERQRETLRKLLFAAQRELTLLSADNTGAYAHPPREMIGNGQRSRVSLIRQFQRRFESSPLCYLLLDPRPGLHIVDINDAYGGATMTERTRIVGARLFEIFPDNPDDPMADGASNLYTSLRVAADTLKPHAMPVQRYDVRDPTGRFVERHWRPINTPITDDNGRVAYLLHHVQDVTGEILSARDRHVE